MSDYILPKRPKRKRFTIKHIYNISARYEVKLVSKIRIAYSKIMLTTQSFPAPAPSDLASTFDSA